MELKDTVEMMLSDDYRERFKAEFHQANHRVNRLMIMLDKYDCGVLPFEPSCPIDLLRKQKKIMQEYVDLLSMRAECENIELYPQHFCSQG